MIDDSAESQQSDTEVTQSVERVREISQLSEIYADKERARDHELIASKLSRLSDQRHGNLNHRDFLESRATVSDILARMTALKELLETSVTTESDTFGDEADLLRRMIRRYRQQLRRMRVLREIESLEADYRELFGLRAERRMHARPSANQPIQETD